MTASSSDLALRSAAFWAWVNERSTGSLTLYTFARNRIACEFYERHGFVAVAHGFEPMWQLAT